MKILVAAYACNPYRGSEGGVGWAAVDLISKKHDVFVITGSKNRALIEKARAEGIVSEKIQFLYVSEGHDYHRIKIVARLQSWSRYIFFNKRILKESLSWHEQVSFDLCHHVTIATWRVPSPLWQMPIPSIWGPIGGTGHVPGKFRPMMSMQARIFELARDLSSYLISRSKRYRDCLQHTDMIFAANKETHDFIRQHRKTKSVEILPIAFFRPEKTVKFRRTGPALNLPVLRCFAGGNMIGSKGLSIAVKALAMAINRGVRLHYTIAGIGPEIPAIQKLVMDLGITEHVSFHRPYQGDDYIKALHGTDVYLLPSFREGTPITLLEACVAGCYPIVADIGVQGEIVNNCGGHAIPCATLEDLTDGIADALEWCAQQRENLPGICATISSGVCESFSMENYQKHLDEAYLYLINQKIAK
jgi:glycosyltransferase involved in cell wall biosynthesis